MSSLCFATNKAKLNLRLGYSTRREGAPSRYVVCDWMYFASLSRGSVVIGVDVCFPIQMFRALGSAPLPAPRLAPNSDPVVGKPNTIQQPHDFKCFAPAFSSLSSSMSWYLGTSMEVCPPTPVHEEPVDPVPSSRVQPRRVDCLKLDPPPTTISWPRPRPILRNN